MFGLFAAGLACFAPLASAYTTPTGTEPKGNPISQPGLNSIVDVNSDFVITWEPTTEGTVSLVLLKGPANNLVPVYAIAEEIENSGSYTWDPKKTLEPSGGAKGYGIQLIDDKTGQYQYTTQFGISNADYKEGSKEETSAAAYAAPSSSSKAAVSAASEYAAPSQHSASKEEQAATTEAETKPTAMPIVDESASASGVPETVVQPTGSMSVPASLQGSTTMATHAAYPTGSNHTINGTNTNSTRPSVEPSTGSASNMAASIGGLVIAAGVAVFAL